MGTYGIFEFVVPIGYEFNRFEDVFTARGVAFNGKRNKSVKGRLSECSFNAIN